MIQRLCDGLVIFPNLQSFLFFLYGAGHRLLWMLALFNAVLNLCSFGVMHNDAVESSIQRIKNLRRDLDLLP